MDTKKQQRRTTKSGQKLTIKFSGIYKLFETLNNHRISESQLRLLYIIDGESSLKNTIVNINQQEIDVLVIGGWLSGWTGQTENPNDYKLTEKGLMFLQEIDELFLKPKKKTAALIVIPPERVLEITEIFPDIKGGSGKYLRCNLSETASALLWFRKNQPQYDWETIMKAATLYVAEQELESYKYARRVKYFIRKMLQDKSWESDLAEYCIRIKSGDLGDRVENHFKEKIV